LTCRVVIADDTPDIRLLLRWSLEPDDRFDVIAEAGNGREVIEILGQESVDAVLLDLAMPEMDGLQAIVEIRKISPETKIVVLSGFDHDSMSGEALARGAHAYLEKGVPFSEIRETLISVCDAA
jgi:DNA-binding NarL/FixJ family response regulator